jgi:hypothetical protein
MFGLVTAQQVGGRKSLLLGLDAGSEPHMRAKTDSVRVLSEAELIHHKHQLLFE